MFKYIADWLIYSAFNLNPETRLGQSLNFFVYDTIKILLLIILVITVVAFVRSFFPPQKIKKVLSRQKFGLGNFLAACFGAITPFCSCSSIPLFLGFLEAEIPLGIAFSFLITSPLVNEVAFIIMGGTFGWQIAFIYAASGILLGTLVGAVLGKMKLGQEIKLKIKKPCCADNNDPQKNLSMRVKFALKQSFGMFKNIWWVVLIGVALGALIHGYVPEKVFTQYLNTNSIFSVPLAALIGIPVYAGCSTVVPIAFAAVTKGVPLGTALAFMMSIAGLSLPAAIILKRAISLKLLLIFFTIVGIGIIIIGYFFNLVPV